MRHDIEIPDKYSIYQPVGDSCGPGGWARSLRSIPVFKGLADQIKELCPNAFVLNYTNPMGTLTKVLSDELGNGRTVGLCHGVFTNLEFFERLFDVTEDDIQMRFGGLNHFFWILDFKVKGQDGYKLLQGKLNGKGLCKVFQEVCQEGVEDGHDILVAEELYKNFGYLTYLSDRHNCEFFNCYITDKNVMDSYKLVRTPVEQRQKWYDNAAVKIRLWTEGKADPVFGELGKKPSRETAADFMKAMTFNAGFVDVVNMVNVGQIDNLPRGAVVETMGYVDSSGPVPLSVGSLPESLAALCVPHAQVQLRTTEAGLLGDREAALMALVEDPMCAHLSATEIKKMGEELLEANREYLPTSFFK
jgi:alpha-galactosidase